MLHIVSYWYVRGPLSLWEGYKRTLSYLEGHLAIRSTFANLGKPLFQDYSREGRIIGVFFRLGRIGVALIIDTLTSIGFLLAALLWLIFPVLCLISLFGGLFGPSITGL